MYDQIARYYDLTHADLTEDIPVVLALAEEAGGPVLELGCGSGRLLLPLARAGYAVTGVDNSAAMLARARARLAAEPIGVQTRVRLVEADMTGFELADDGRFPLIIIPYNTFLHLDTTQKMAALRQIKQYVRQDGRLFIDLINPFWIAATPDDDAPILENELTDPETGSTILQFAQNQLDEAAQTLSIIWTYETPPPKIGAAPQRITAKASYHYLFPHQIELLLRDAGFKLESLAGDYDRSPFDENSERLLITAKPLYYQ